MTDSAPTNLKKPIRIVLVIFSIFIFYLFAISKWYWDCAAQINPITLSVACPSVRGEHHVREQGNANETFEERVWPDFGAHNNTYDDTKAFWGDDFISNFFKNVFQLMAGAIGPVVRETIIPMWNSAMEPSATRATLYGAIVWVLSIVGGEAIKDIYRRGR